MGEAAAATRHVIFGSLKGLDIRDLQLTINKKIEKKASIYGIPNAHIKLKVLLKGNF